MKRRLTPVAGPWALTLVALCSVVVGSCGGDGSGDDAAPPRESNARPAVELSIRAADAGGREKEARLECRGAGAEASGFPGRDPAELCARARRLAAFLAARPDPGRVCTQIYGGPETARLRGTIGGRDVDRELARRNGCEIADWDRVAPLLPVEAESGSANAPG